MKKVAITAAILAFSSVALASDWHLVWEGEKDPQQPKCISQGYVDLDSAKKVGNQVSVWSKSEKGPTHTTCPKEKFKTLMAYSQFDCDARTLRDLHLVTYDWNGKSVFSANVDDGSIEPVTPDTFGDSVLKTVCQ